MIKEEIEYVKQDKAEKKKADDEEKARSRPLWKRQWEKDKRKRKREEERKLNDPDYVAPRPKLGEVLKEAIQNKIYRTEAELNVRKEFFGGDDLDDTGYRTLPRITGSGPLRLGTVLGIGDDVYSLLLASNLKKVVVDKHKCEAYL